MPKTTNSGKNFSRSAKRPAGEKCGSETASTPAVDLTGDVLSEWQRPLSGEHDKAVVSPYVKCAGGVLVHRSRILSAPYHPRVISDEARKRLKSNIERVGLIDLTIWNRRTGNTVGGHQRLSILDSLHRGKPYLLPVQVVDLDEKTEKEQNVFLNNSAAQGDYDPESLELLLSEIDGTAAGFSESELIQMFGDISAAVSAESLAAAADAGREMDKWVAKGQENLKKRMDQDWDYYAVVVFASHADRKAFTDRLRAEDNRYVNGATLMGLLSR
ncbi:MAG: hypothetical protein E6R03_13785 [Hyphomicrobiaceae bacterium]|nr:MAG: hypothetical protein E6R03_13785 [Hyphomicrobiaceae bacterium]